MADQGHIPYTITSQNLTEELTPDGRFQDTWQVQFQTPAGVHAYVRVPVSQYSAGAVDAAIQDYVRSIEEVHSLGSEPHPDNLAQ